MSVGNYLSPYNNTPVLPRIFYVPPNSVFKNLAFSLHKIFSFTPLKYLLSELSELPTHLGLVLRSFLSAYRFLYSGHSLALSI